MLILKAALSVVSRVSQHRRQCYHWRHISRGEKDLGNCVPVWWPVASGLYYCRGQYSDNQLYSYCCYSAVYNALYPKEPDALIVLGAAYGQEAKSSQWSITTACLYSRWQDLRFRAGKNRWWLLSWIAVSQVFLIHQLAKKALKWISVRCWK